MTKQEIIKKVNSFQGANREFSQEMGPIVEGILDLVDDNTEAIEGKQDAPEENGTAGQILKLDANGEPVWADAPDGSVIDDEMSNESPNPVKNNVIWSWVTELIATVKEWASNLFAKQDGWYDTLVSGAAKNLVGHGTTPAEYTFRTSGGNADIGTGAATIDMLKGKTLKWNQLISDDSEPVAAGVVFSRVGTTNWWDVSTSDANQALRWIIATIFGGHKYYCRYSIKTNSSVVLRIDAYSGTDGPWETINGNGYLSYIYSRNDDMSNRGIGVMAQDANVTFQVGNPQIIDLTLMFGAGNEPTTVEEFEALYPLDYYAYTATPVLINNAASGIETTGFNQWDEEWEVGGIDYTTGELVEANSVRPKNYVRIFPSTSYYYPITGSYFGLAYYDINKQFISGKRFAGGLDTSPSNAAYIKFNVEAYGQTYNHDICINLSWSGYRNGEYEPYEKHTLYFNGESGSLATVTGKKIVGGVPTGESVIVWPEGMKGFGGKFDFGKADSDGYIRVGNRVFGVVVDLGNASWTRQGEHIFYTSINGMLKTNSVPIILNTGKYTRKTGLYSTWDSENNYYGTRTNYTYLYFQDINCSTVEQIEAAMNGVILYYELETPEEYLLDTPIPANYLVNDFGTEQRIPVDTASNVMAPVLYDCQYALNAVDTVRRLPITYIKKESMDNFTTELASKLGTFLNATITITPSYDATDEEYDYSITITANENNG